MSKELQKQIDKLYREVELLENSTNPLDVALVDLTYQEIDHLEQLNSDMEYWHNYTYITVD